MEVFSHNPDMDMLLDKESVSVISPGKVYTIGVFCFHLNRRLSGAEHKAKR